MSRKQRKIPPKLLARLDGLRTVIASQEDLLESDPRNPGAQELRDGALRTLQRLTRELDLPRCVTIEVERKALPLRPYLLVEGRYLRARAMLIQHPVVVADLEDVECITVVDEGKPPCAIAGLRLHWATMHPLIPVSAGRIVSFDARRSALIYTPA